MRLTRLVAVTLATLAAFTVPSSSQAAEYTQTTSACKNTALASATNTDSRYRTSLAGSDVVAVPGDAHDVSILCRLQVDPTFSLQLPETHVRWQRICVGVNVCNGKSGWICVGVNVCNGNKPSNDICVGADVCNAYYKSAVMLTDVITANAAPGEPLFLCSVVSWRDGAGNQYYSAYDANPQAPGAQCPLSSVA